MYRHAAISAAQPNSSLKAPSVAIPSCHGRNEGCSVPCFCGLFAAERRAAVWAILRRRDREDDFSASGSLPPRIPSSTRGHASGPFRRPSARRRSAFSGPPKTSLKSRGKVRRSNFFRAPPIKHSLALGSRAHSLALRRVTRAGYGKFNETEITTMYSEQSHPHRLPRQRRRGSHQRQPQPHHSLARNQELLQEGRQVHRAHRMAPLRSLRQARRVRSNAQERRSYPGRRRAA